jgi:hypothetical protein
VSSPFVPTLGMRLCSLLLQLSWQLLPALQPLPLPFPFDATPSRRGQRMRGSRRLLLLLVLSCGCCSSAAVPSLPSPLLSSAPPLLPLRPVTQCPWEASGTTYTDSCDRFCFVPLRVCFVRPPSFLLNGPHARSCSCDPPAEQSRAEQSSPLHRARGTGHGRQECLLIAPSSCQSACALPREGTAARAWGTDGTSKESPHTGRTRERHSARKKEEITLNKQGDRNSFARNPSADF